MYKNSINTTLSRKRSYFESLGGNFFWISGPFAITCLHLPPLPHLSASSILILHSRPHPTRLFPSFTPVVVMAMESAPASAPGVVAMEIPVRGALPVVEEDEDFSAPLPGCEGRLGHRRGTGRRRRGVPFNRGSYYMLIVIGEIGTEHQLDTTRAQIERGEWGRPSALLPVCLPWFSVQQTWNSNRRDVFWRNDGIVSIGRSRYCSIAPWDTTHFPYPQSVAVKKLQTHRGRMEFNSAVVWPKSLLSSKYCTKHLQTLTNYQIKRHKSACQQITICTGSL